MIAVFSRIEHDLHRNPLHDLHVIAGGILGRQQAETGAAGAGNAIDLALVAFSVGIDFDRDPLADFHIAKLGFLEVGGDPDIVERNDLHQFLAGGDVLADFDGAVADYACDRSNDFGVLQIQLRLIEVSFLLLGLRPAPTRPWRR